jgi:hypothetical protein
VAWPSTRCAPGANDASSSSGRSSTTGGSTWPTCRRDRDRLTAGEAPDVRLVRVGDRYVPWWQADGPLLREGLGAHVHGGGHDSITRRHAAEATTRSTLNQAGSGGGMFGP